MRLSFRSAITFLRLTLTSRPATYGFTKALLSIILLKALYNSERASSLASDEAWPRSRQRAQR